MFENWTHTLEGAALGYLLAGTFLFFIVSALGIVESATLARGRPVRFPVMILAIAIAILLWPKTAKRLWVHRRQTAKMLARILGVRS